MKCTGVAGRAFPDGQVSRRNPVISVVLKLKTIMQTDGSDEMETVRARHRSKTTGRNGSDANRDIDWIDIGC
jgi:hypothetical protein